MVAPIHLTANVERFSGFADRYDEFRPQPPRALLDVLCQLAQSARPRRVVDLGSGTGLSTRIWVERADAVVGVEPNAEMRALAEARDAANGKRAQYQAGFSHDTNLPDASADIVTCSQALHWMEPEATFAEVARILRPGGVFAAYDCDWPPTMNWEAETAYNVFDARAVALGKARDFYRGVKKSDKATHLARMRASGRFRFLKEIVLHHVEMGNAERLVGLALSQGSVATLLKRGLSEAEVGLPEFRRAVQRALGEGASEWYFSYRVRLGIK